MKRDDLADLVAADCGISKKNAKIIVSATFLRMAEVLGQGEEIHVPSFGKFEIRRSKAHTSRNPANGQPVEVPERNRLHFSPSGVLKSAVKASS